jgi:hypothetical protein
MDLLDAERRCRGKQLQHSGARPAALHGGVRACCAEALAKAGSSGAGCTYSPRQIRSSRLREAYFKSAQGGTRDLRPWISPAALRALSSSLIVAVSFRGAFCERRSRRSQRRGICFFSPVSTRKGKADSSLLYAGCKYSPHPSLGMTRSGQNQSQKPQVAGWGVCGYQMHFVQSR